MISTGPPAPKGPERGMAGSNALGTSGPRTHHPAQQRPLTVTNKGGTTMATRCAVYCRVSTAKQEDKGSSLRTQLDECRKYAAAKGYTVVAEYEEVFTGTALFERPKLSDLREVIRAKAVDKVVCYAIDRLSRDSTHLGVILTEAEAKGVAVEFVSEPLDDSPEGQLIRYIRGYAAKIEHIKIMERSRRGREQRARDGKPIPGGSPPIGYQWRWSIGGKSGKPTVIGWDIDSEKAPLVRRFFRFIARGGTLTALAKQLNDEGVPTNKGGQFWYHRTLSFIIENPIYKGQPEALKERYESVKGRREGMRRRPENERVKLPLGTAPALVSPEEWQAANDQIARNQTESKRRNSNPEAYLLRSGFLFCGYCGSPLISCIHDGLPKYRCSSQNQRNSRQCPGGGTIVARELDEAVWSKILPILAHPESLLEQIEREIATEDTTEADRQAVCREIDRITRQQSVVSSAIARLDDVDAAEPLLAKLEMLARQKLELKGEREAIDSRRADLVTGQQLLQRMYRMLDRDIEAIASMPYAEKRQTLHRLGVSVKLWQMKHEPRYQIDMAVDPARFLSDPDFQPLEGSEIWSDSIPTDLPLGVFKTAVIADSTSISSTAPSTT